MSQSSPKSCLCKIMGGKGGGGQRPFSQCVKTTVLVWDCVPEEGAEETQASDTSSILWCDTSVFAVGEEASVSRNLSARLQPIHGVAKGTCLCTVEN